MSRHDQSGSIAVVQATILLVVVVLGGIATLDVGALLRAARVATAAADGAALAASTASQPVSRTLPRAAAERVARAHGATLDTCDCGGPRAQVAVALPVSTRLLDHFGITEVRASATADLVPLSTPTSNSTANVECAVRWDISHWTAHSTLGWRALGPHRCGRQRNPGLVHSLGLSDGAVSSPGPAGCRSRRRDAPRGAARASTIDRGS